NFLDGPWERSCRWRLRQCPHDGLVEAINQAGAAIGYQPDLPGLTRLETHSSSRRNVQTIPKSSLSIAGKSRVGPGGMIMTAHLDGSVACVGDFEIDGRSVLVEHNLAKCRKHLARYHVRLPLNELGRGRSRVWSHRETLLPPEFPRSFRRCLP